MANHPPVVTLEKFQGLNNRYPPERIGAGFLATAQNVDIDTSGGLRKRKGYQQLYAGQDIHSLFISRNDTFYLIEGQNLVRLNPDFTGTVLASGFQLNQRVEYYELNDHIYFTSKALSGVIDGDLVRPWGIPVPAGNGTLTVSPNGSLPRMSTDPTGDLVGMPDTYAYYQVALTYVASDGRESGTMLSNRVYVDYDNARITISNIPQSSDPTVVAINVYCSTASGEVLYKVKTIPHGTTTTAIYEVHEAMVPLKTQFYMPPPKGDLLALYNGRLYIANGKTLWYTEPHGYEWCKTGTNFISFDDDIRLIMPVDDGIFVATKELQFLEGTGPESFRLRQREPITGVKGTSVKIAGSVIIMENIPTGFKWLFSSDKGIILVGTGGMVFNLSEANVKIDKSDEGAALFRSDEGIDQYLTVLKDPSNNRMKVGDQVQAIIVRNGIVIE